MSHRSMIGVAIPIPEPYAAELAEWRDVLGDPQARLVPPHVTLLPPTPVDSDRLAAVEQHLVEVAAGERPFQLHLRGAATFRPVSPVVFVPLALGISDCERLEELIRSGLLYRPLRFPYHPHVTVAHDLPESVLDKAFDLLVEYEATFEVDGFNLYEHGSDGVWRTRRRFEFSGGMPDRT
jgi:2'-5' RNA ligase